MRAKNAKVAEFPKTVREAPAAQLGTLIAVDETGNLIVQFPERAPVAARLATAATAEFLHLAIDERRQAVAVFQRR